MSPDHDTTHNRITIVSGLPRSGTSLMMQMLQAGGMPILIDNIRNADVDNPRGYCELQKVKNIERDATWLPEARGRAFKMVSQLLYHLPATESYQIVFMERQIDEMLSSQEKMLTRLGRDAAPREQIRRAYTLHLHKLNVWLRRQDAMRLLRVSYNTLVERPTPEAARVNEFLGRQLGVARMVATVDPSLYRNRTPGCRTRPRPRLKCSLHECEPQEE